MTKSNCPVDSCSQPVQKLVGYNTVTSPISRTIEKSPDSSESGVLLVLRCISEFSKHFKQKNVLPILQKYAARHVFRCKIGNGLATHLMENKRFQRLVGYDTGERGSKQRRLRKGNKCAQLVMLDLMQNNKTKVVYF